MSRSVTIGHLSNNGLFGRIDERNRSDECLPFARIAFRVQPD